MMFGVLMRRRGGGPGGTLAVGMEGEGSYTSDGYVTRSEEERELIPSAVGG